MGNILNWSLPCKCGDCGSFQIMYVPSDVPDKYRTYFRCRTCERTYSSIEKLIDQEEDDAYSL